jgi:hypothetical protein
MVDCTVLGYMNAIYSVNENYSIEARDAMGIPVDIQLAIQKSYSLSIKIEFLC